MINYGNNPFHSVNFHYKTKFISTYQNKLLFNVFTPGIINKSQNFSIQEHINDDYEIATEGDYLKINKDLIFLIRPNNQFSTNSIVIDNYNKLSIFDKKKINYQIIKCELLESIIEKADITKPYFVAELIWHDGYDNAVDFYFTDIIPENNDNRILICSLEFNTLNNKIKKIILDNQTKSKLNNNILYNFNADMLNSYHAGNSGISGYIPINNRILNHNLNAKYINSIPESLLARKEELNENLNAEYIVDKDKNKYKVGNNYGDIPLSNKNINIGLNAEKLNDKDISQYSLNGHEHNLDDIEDGIIYKKVLGVNSNNLLENDSFKDKSFSSKKLNNNSFITKNDDNGGRLKIVTGKHILEYDSNLISFDVEFINIPTILLQIEKGDTTDFNKKYIKIQAESITNSSFILRSELYYTNTDNSKFQIVNPPYSPKIICDWVAIGYEIE